MRSQYLKTLIIIPIVLVLITLLSALPLDASNGSTILSLEPEVISYPFLELAQGNTLVLVQLYAQDVHDLTEFSITVTFEGRIVRHLKTEFAYPTEGGLIAGGHSSSGGLPPYQGYGGFEYEADWSEPVSGSGPLVTFFFEAKEIGSTEIILEQTELRDSQGSTILHTISRNTVRVEILSFEVWLDGEYEKLNAKYDELQMQYSDLEETLDTLSGEYNSLSSNYTSLQGDYNSLSSEHTLLESDYTALDSNYASLEEDYDDLSSEHQSMIEQLEESNNQLNTKQMLMYGFIVLSVVFISTTVLLVVRGKRYHS